MPKVVVFDVIETLLDLRALEPYFARVFRDVSAREQWFQRLLKTALVTTITGPYQDFARLGRAALQMTAALRGVELTEDDTQDLREALLQLPAHPDVSGALSDLKGAGYRLVSLSNNARESSVTQLEHAKLAGFFDLMLSADDVRRLKPAPEPYRHAAEQLGVPTSEMWMVAAHGWDIDGARNAGCRTAFVAREGHALNPLMESPDVTGKNLEEVAQSILRLS